MKKIEILKPSIFPKDKILSGVTKKNLDIIPPYGLSISNSDILSDEQVLNHKKLLAESLGYSFENMKFQKQIHSDFIQIITKNSPNGLETDAMITSEKGIILNVSIADCTGILMFDTINEVVAAVHSGWKGTQQNIIGKTIKKLENDFNTNPLDLIAYLSPSASGRNYEVEWDVAKYFPNSITKIKETKFLYDNKKQITEQLMDSGVLKTNIEISDICTMENIDFHSYRRDKNQSGRMSAYIGMIE